MVDYSKALAEYTDILTICLDDFWLRGIIYYNDSGILGIEAQHIGIKSSDESKALEPPVKYLIPVNSICYIILI